MICTQEARKFAFLLPSGENMISSSLVNFGTHKSEESGNLSPFFKNTKNRPYLVLLRPILDGKLKRQRCQVRQDGLDLVYS